MGTKIERSGIVARVELTEVELMLLLRLVGNHTTEQALDRVYNELYDAAENAGLLTESEDVLP